MKRSFILFLLLVSQFCSAQYKLRVEITQWPSKHASDTFYIAGNFNGWEPHKTAMLNDGNKRIFEMTMGSDQYEFKITRGGWDKVEGGKNGEDIANRHVLLGSDSTIRIEVAGWKDDFGPSGPVVSTASKNVFVLDTAFYIPQLDRHRRIWMYLPADYKTSNKRYPVLYMHDGQNIFDASTGFAGEWGVDECLDSLKKKCIVVGVDHGGKTRVTEYNAYNSSFGDGEGKKYVEFLVKTLKPYIDKKYRTLKDQQNTFIAGSSMGGLISYYAITKYPKVFGAAGVFSPSFWLSKDSVRKEIKAISTPPKGTRIYFVAGDSESKTMVSDMKEVAMLGSKFRHIPYSIKATPGGRHTESSWRAELPAFFKWLLK